MKPNCKEVIQEERRNRTKASKNQIWISSFFFFFSSYCIEFLDVCNGDDDVNQQFHGAKLLIQDKQWILVAT